jgi:2-polyprenyl-6-methoxyphenol hydroxylase-like FAD-dependent oxidoreductase
MANDTDVLFVGAGPTGLVLALWLTRLGVKVRIVDQTAAPGETSRALAVHARTLEFYDQIGLAAEVVARGRKLEAGRLWVGGKQRARVVFGDTGLGLSPFPYALIFPQDEHERVLVERLAASGVTVERPVQLVGFETVSGGVTAHLAGGAQERVEAAFIAGCDGARSNVRELIGSSFPGGTYSHLFYVADVEASGPVMNGDLNLALDDAEFLAVFPLAGEARARLVGTIEREDDRLTFDDVSQHVIERLALKIAGVNWFSTYRVHHRVAQTWRAGPAFLLGDAAHLHSPVGGQGMNTGIGDAVNLAWKLAAVIRGKAHADILGTYEPERIAFAKRLVATTDRAFQVINTDGPVARFARLVAAPLILPTAARLTPIRRLIFLTLSQTNVNYRGDVLAEGAAGGVRGGDRLPWVRQADGSDNFASLKNLSWQGHVYGTPDTRLQAACDSAELPLAIFAWNPEARRAGIARDAFHLVRPDGYVGLVCAGDASAALEAYQARHGLKFEARA